MSVNENSSNSVKAGVGEQGQTSVQAHSPGALRGKLLVSCLKAAWHLLQHGLHNLRGSL